MDLPLKLEILAPGERVKMHVGHDSTFRTQDTSRTADNTH